MDGQTPVSVASNLATDRITVLLVEGDPAERDVVAARLNADDEFDVIVETRLSDALARVEDADCVVSGYAPETPGGRELYESVRERDLPFVLLAADDAFADRLRDDDWSDYLPSDRSTAADDDLTERVRRLVDHRRAWEQVQRTTAGLETVQEAVAIAGPDGNVEVVNRAFASRFGYDRERLLGTPWRDLVDDDEVERLDSTAIPTVEDGWRWVGSCVGRRRDGERITVRLRIAGLDDGSLVFATRDGDSAPERK